MSLFLFIIGILFYCAQAWNSYSGVLKGSMWFYIFGIAVAALTAVAWYCLIRNSEGIQVYKYSMIWDTIAAASFFFVPLLVFGVKLNAIAAAGLALMVIGCGMINFS